LVRDWELDRCGPPRVGEGDDWLSCRSFLACARRETQNCGNVLATASAGCSRLREAPRGLPGFHCLALRLATTLPLKLCVGGCWLATRRHIASSAKSISSRGEQKAVTRPTYTFSPSPSTPSTSPSRLSAPPGAILKLVEHLSHARTPAPRSAPPLSLGGSRVTHSRQTASPRLRHPHNLQKSGGLTSLQNNVAAPGSASPARVAPPSVSSLHACDSHRPQGRYNIDVRDLFIWKLILGTRGCLGSPAGRMSPWQQI
jgi:hypothetical protein